MDPNTGAFNYSGLVANMEMKAGMFYGKGYFFVYQRYDRYFTNGLGICKYSGLRYIISDACGEREKSPGLSNTKHYSRHSRPSANRRYAHLTEDDPVACSIFDQVCMASYFKMRRYSIRQLDMVPHGIGM